MFGAKPKTVRWTVAKKTIEEMNHLFKELKIPANEKLIGVDGLFFLRQFGVEWTEAFLERINDLKRSLYLFVDENPKISELKWFKDLTIPAIPDLSVFRNAALINRSDVIITGNSLMYALAGLMNKPAIGFFKEDELETYCPQTATLRGISYNRDPDPEMVDKTIEIISKL